MQAYPSSTVQQYLAYELWLRDRGIAFPKRVGPPSVDLVSKVSSQVRFLILGDQSTKAEESKPFTVDEQTLLDQVLEELGIHSKFVYFSSLTTNSTPSGGLQRPLLLDMNRLENLLKTQQPKLIVGLGQAVGQTLLNQRTFDIKSDHGKLYDIDIGAWCGQLLTAFHPRTALFAEIYKQPLREDFKNLLLHLD